MTARRFPLSRGVSLIEAIVALAVMATGLLGIVGVQSTLRSNSDISKQRSEAVRLAQARIEELRLFANVSGGTPSFAGIIGSTEIIAADATRGVNATYTRTAQVIDMDTRGGVDVLDAIPRAKSVRVSVTWQDRTGQVQAVTLNAAIAGTPPALAGTLAIPPDGDPARLPLGRNRSIPPSAVNLNDGYSAYLPPSAPSGVVWVFNNVSGIIQLCNLWNNAAGLTRSNLNCAESFARLVSGFVRFSLGAQPTESDARQPASARPVDLEALVMVVDRTAPSPDLSVFCIMDASNAHRFYTAFYCAVPVRSPSVEQNPAWSGALRAGDEALFADAANGNPAGPYRLCRYIMDQQDLTITPVSVSVGSSFIDIRASLVNRNFLVISHQSTCPSRFPEPYPVPNPPPVLPNPFPLWLVQHQPAP